MKTYYIKTFGCQMNEADSEKIAGYYQARGFLSAKSIKEADEIVINTCSVRQSAEDRVYGLINNLAQRINHKQSLLLRNKPLARRPKLILTGCMLRYSIKWLREKMPQVDQFKRIEEFTYHTPYAIRHTLTHAWVPIMEGCNNFCTYCVVPYARGRERSRPFEEIICGVEELVRRGYKEITLLGQNVNSYGNDFSTEKKRRLLHHFNDLNLPRRQVGHFSKNITSIFALLLRTLHETEGLRKIKFLTSNPWDLTEDIIRSIELPKVEKYLHLPVQSGDDEILRRMNRKYTASQYLLLVKKIRKAIPEIEIGTDIIVGFPGETKKQFQNTVDLAKRIGFKMAYIAMYSPRSQTTAFKLSDNVTHKEKKRRWQILEELINKPHRSV